MPRTPAMDRAIRKYEAEKVDHILIRVPKGDKEKIQAYALQHGESMNGFIVRVIKEKIECEEKDSI